MKAREARELLRALDDFTAPQNVDAALKSLSDEQLRMILLTLAESIRQVKVEAMRRNLWDDWKKEKVSA